MKIEKVYNWLSKAVFQEMNPQVMEILAYTESETPKGTNRRLLLKSSTGGQYQVDIFGETVNELIEQLGDETDRWISRKVSVMLVKKGDKDIKKFKALP